MTNKNSFALSNYINMAIIPIVTKTTFKIVDFIDWSRRGRIRLSPEFQRRSVWKEGAKSFLIDTIVRGFPIPIIFLRERNSDTITFEPMRDVIDGQQRLRTVIAFVAPELAPTILKDYDESKDSFTVSAEHNEEIAGLSFNELEEDYKQNILQYEFSVHVIPPSVSDRDIYSIFRRMNSTNFNLKGQELRNSQFFGQFKTSQYGLAGEQLQRWREWGTFQDQEIARMDEVELTSEISMSILERKILGKSTVRLQKYYQTHDKVYKHKNLVEKRFRETMNFIYKNFKHTEVIFLQKRMFYTFFFVCYDLLYGLKAELKNKAANKQIAPKIISDLKVKSDNIRERTANLKILQATDRRTTNIKERGILFKYLFPSNA